jgi:hypothetical protein
MTRVHRLCSLLILPVSAAIKGLWHVLECSLLRAPGSLPTQMQRTSYLQIYGNIYIVSLQGSLGTASLHRADPYIMQWSLRCKDFIIGKVFIYKDFNSAMKTLHFAIFFNQATLSLIENVDILVFCQ